MPLHIDTAAVGEELANVVRAAVADYTIAASALAARMSSDQVQAILYTAVLEVLPIPPLAATASAADVAAREALLAQRDRAFELVAAAEKQWRQSANDLKLSGLEAARQILTKAGAIGLKVLLGLLVI